VTVVETTQLIEPHGGKLIDRTGPRPDGIDRFEQIPLTSRELSDLDMLASGALSPLEGFMNQHDYERVGWVASRLTRQGGAVIAATISPYEATRPVARERIDEVGTFVEI
jgi:hypothetical protein